MASQRASSTFCWLPPESSPTFWCGAGRLDPQPLHEGVHDPVDRGLGDQADAGQPGQRGQRDVLAYRQPRHDALGLAVLGQQADAGPDRGRRSSRVRTGAPATVTRPRVQRQRAGDGLGGLATAGAEQPAEADDLAGADRRATTPCSWWPRVRLRRRCSTRLAAAASCAPVNLVTPSPRTSPISRPSISETSRSRSRSGERPGVHQAAVAQHGDPVADRVQLVQAVADVDDRDALVAQPADDPEEGLHLARFEGGGGLVHDDHAGVDGDGAGERDHLLGADAQCAQRAADVDADAVVAQASLGRAVHPAEVDQARAGCAARGPRKRLRATLISGMRLTSW